MGLRSCHLFFRPLCQSPYDRDLAAQNVCWHENLLAELTSNVQFGVNILASTSPGSATWAYRICKLKTMCPGAWILGPK